MLWGQNSPISIKEDIGSYLWTEIDNPIIPHWNGSETTVLPNGKDEIKLADGKAVYVEDNYMSVIWCTCRISQIPICEDEHLWKKKAKVKFQ